jgi:hypothetical protein
MPSPAFSKEDVAAEVARRARAELIHRQNTKEFRKAAAQAVIERGRTDTPPFEAQRKVLDDNSRLICLCCSRRAGKSELLGRLISKTLIACRHGEWVVFGAKTLGIAKDIIWAELHAINKRYCLGWKINDSDLSITTLRGGRFRLFGVDDKQSVDKVRGKKYRLVICDEASTYEVHLKELVQKAFDPGTKDLDGRIILSGTPGYVKSGYWFEASQLPGPWSKHHWTIFDNPHIANAEQKLRDTREMFGWDEDHPTYVAEYLGRWVDNSSLLVCDFLESRNVVREMPAHYNNTWRHVIGIDYGFNDRCAWPVIAVDPHSGERYLMHGFAEERLLGDDPSNVTRYLVDEYKTSYVVCDPAGGGKGFFETFNAQHGLSMGCIIRAANKVDKLGSIRLLNAELRTGRFKFLIPECSESSSDPDVVERCKAAAHAREVVGEMKRLLWKDERKDTIIEGPAFPDDLFDATRYALLETVAWRSTEKPPTETPAELEARLARQARAKRAERKSTAAWFERR